MIKELTRKKLTRYILIAVVAFNALVVLYDLTMASYFDYQDRDKRLRQIVSELEAQGFVVSNSELSGNGLVLVFGASNFVDKKIVREQLNSGLCTYKLSDNSLNIRLRYSDDVRYTNSGESLGSWQHYDKHCNRVD